MPGRPSRLSRVWRASCLPWPGSLGRRECQRPRYVTSSVRLLKIGVPNSASRRPRWVVTSHTSASVTTASVYGMATGRAFDACGGQRISRLLWSGDRWSIFARRCRRAGDAETGRCSWRLRRLPGCPRTPVRAGLSLSGFYWSGIQLPWRPRGMRAGRWTRATGWPVKSWAARMTRSAAPRSGLWTKAIT